MGNVIRYSDQLYGAWGSLEDALRTGKPALPAQTYLGDDPARTRALRAGHARTCAGHRARAGADARPARAGARCSTSAAGRAPIRCCSPSAFPACSAEVLELPGVAAVARELVAAAGAQRARHAARRRLPQRRFRLGQGRGADVRHVPSRNRAGLPRPDRACRGLPQPRRPAGGQRRVHRRGRLPARLRGDVRPEHDADRPRRRRARRCRREALDGRLRLAGAAHACRCRRRCRTAW